MRDLGFVLQLLLASAIASAAAGMLVVFCSLAASVLASESSLGVVLLGLLFVAVISILAGLMGIVPTVMFMTLPTFVIGAWLWTSGPSRAWARRRRTYAIVGLLLGSAAYAVLLLAGLLAPFEEPGPFSLERPLAFAAFALSGAGAGLVFRSSMFAIGRFMGDPGDAREGKEVRP